MPNVTVELPRPLAASRTQSRFHQVDAVPAPPTTNKEADPGDKVFVYGSLLPGLHNHGLLQDADFLGYHATFPTFEMFSLGAFPAVCKEGQTSISGALFRVDLRTLTRLDELESHPQWYRREAVYLPTAGCSAWMYVMPRGMADVNSRLAQPVCDGDWETYYLRLSLVAG